MATSTSSRAAATVHLILWYSLIAWFAVGAGGVALRQGWGATVFEWGVVGMLITIPLRIVVLAESFRGRGQSGFMLLSYGLVLMLLGAMALKAVLP